MKVPSIFTDTLKGLVSRRLWPVAVLLLAALVAVPFVLSRAAEPVAPATPATSTGKDGAAETLVSVGGTTENGRRRVLGTEKDPFQPAPTPKKKSAKKAKAASADTTVTTGGDASTGAATGGSTTTGGTTTTGGSTGSGSGSGSGSSGSGSKTASNSLAVRFGSADSDSLTASVLGPLEALPSQSEPIAIYLGLENHGKVAVFLLGDGVTVNGDGVCDPKPSQCDKIRLKAGETEYLTVAGSTSLADGEYQLDVVKIKR